MFRCRADVVYCISRFRCLELRCLKLLTHDVTTSAVGLDISSMKSVDLLGLNYKYELLCHHNERCRFIANKCAEHIESLLRIILRIFLQYIWQHKPLHIGEYIVNKFTKFYTSTFYTFLGYASYKISI